MSGTVEAPLTAGRLLLRALRRHRGRILFGVVLLSVHQAAEALVPVAIGVIIDRAVATGDVPALLLSVIGLAALFTVLSMAWKFGARQAVVAIQRETHRLRMEVTARLLDPRGQRGGLRAGELLSVATSDAERAAMAVRAGSAGVAALVALTVASVALLTVDVPLGAGVLLGVPVLVVLPQVLAPPLTRRSLTQQAAAAQTTALAADLVGGLRALRGIGAQDNAARRYRRASQDALSATLRAAVANGASEGLTVAASGLFLAGVAGFAGWFALNGRLSIGELVTVVGLAQFIAEPMRALGMCGRLAAMASASAARLATVLNAPPLVEPGTLPVPPRFVGPRVVLEAVSYRTLQDVSLEVAPGELLGIVTHDPADADCLLALLSGRVPRGDYQGRVLIGGVAVEALDVDASRAAVLVEQHDVDLFEGTMRSNLLAGAPAVAERAGLEGALRAAAADEVADAHPDGLDQVVADRGATLSGGQRQRIGLARALLADPPVLVLHDPTTAVDAVTEELIAEGLAALRGGGPDAPSTIMVTSSPALLGQAHRVLVIDGGRITAEGRHGELAETDLRYREAVLR